MYSRSVRCGQRCLRLTSSRRYLHSEIVHDITPPQLQTPLAVIEHPKSSQLITTFAATSPQLPSALVTSLNAIGFVRPTRIQQFAYRSVLRTVQTGQSALIMAESGAGKTLAYVLPTLAQIISLHNNGRRRRPHTIVLTLTRDLCAQVNALIRHLIGANTHMTHSYYSGIQSLTSNVLTEVMIMTPATLHHHIQTHPNSALLRDLTQLVIDEADALVSGSNAQNLQQIITALRKVAPQLRFIAVCATLSTAGTKSVSYQLRQLIPNITQIYSTQIHKQLYRKYKKFIKCINDNERQQYLINILQEEYQFYNKSLLSISTEAVPSSLPSKRRIIIFTNVLTTSTAVYDYIKENISNIMSRSPTPTSSSQANTNIRCFIINRHVKFHDRLTVINAFNNDQFLTHDTTVNNTAIALDILVCTNIVNRGIDFVDVKHVIEYNVATDVTEHIHRCGRTNRSSQRNINNNYNDNNTNNNNADEHRPEQDDADAHGDNERIGRVTSFYGVEDELLVDSIQRSDRVSVAFSRKRSLRRRHKRAQHRALQSNETLHLSHDDVNKNQADEVATDEPLTHVKEVEQKM